jgi:hypothetical protein
MKFKDRRWFWIWLAILLVGIYGLRHSLWYSYGIFCTLFPPPATPRNWRIVLFLAERVFLWSLPLLVGISEIFFAKLAMDAKGASLRLPGLPIRRSRAWDTLAKVDRLGTELKGGPALVFTPLEGRPWHVRLKPLELELAWRYIGIQMAGRAKGEAKQGEKEAEATAAPHSPAGMGQLAEAGTALADAAPFAAAKPGRQPWRGGWRIWRWGLALAAALLLLAGLLSALAAWQYRFWDTKSDADYLAGLESGQLVPQPDRTQQLAAGYIIKSRQEAQGGPDARPRLTLAKILLQGPHVLNMSASKWKMERLFDSFAGDTRTVAAALQGLVPYLRAAPYDGRAMALAGWAILIQGRYTESQADAQALYRAGINLIHRALDLDLYDPVVRKLALDWDALDFERRPYFAVMNREKNLGSTPKSDSIYALFLADPVAWQLDARIMLERKPDSQSFGLNGAQPPMLSRDFPVPPAPVSANPYIAGAPGQGFPGAIPMLAIDSNTRKLAVINEFRGDTAAAEGLFKSLADALPRDLWAQADLLAFYVRNGRQELADQCVSRESQLDPALGRILAQEELARASDTGLAYLSPKERVKAIALRVRGVDPAWDGEAAATDVPAEVLTNYSRLLDQQTVYCSYVPPRMALLDGSLPTEAVPGIGELDKMVEEAQKQFHPLPACPLVMPATDAQGHSSALGSLVSLAAMERAAYLPEAVLRLGDVDTLFSGWHTYRDDAPIGQPLATCMMRTLNVRDLAWCSLQKAKQGWDLSLRCQGTRPEQSYHKHFPVGGLQKAPQWMAACLHRWMGTALGEAQAKALQEPLFASEADLLKAAGMEEAYQESPSFAEGWADGRWDHASSALILRRRDNAWRNQRAIRLGALEQALAKQPSNAGLRLLRARAWRERGCPMSALREDFSLLAQDADNPTLYDDILEGLQEMHDTALGLRLLESWSLRQPENPVPQRMLGRAYIDFAWEVRGSGYADTVSSAAWDLVEDRLAQAGQSLERSLRLQPDDVGTLTTMISYLTAHDGGGGTDPKPRILFNQAQAVNPDDTRPGYALLNYLAPKWHGSLAEMFSFAKEQYAHNPDLLVRAWLECIQEQESMEKGADKKPPYDPHAFDDTRRAFVEMAGRHPGSASILSQYAYYAAYYMHWDEYQALHGLFQKIPAAPQYFRVMTLSQAFPSDYPGGVAKLGADLDAAYLDLLAAAPGFKPYQREAAFRFLYRPKMAPQLAGLMDALPSMNRVLQLMMADIRQAEMDARAEASAGGLGIGESATAAEASAGGLGIGEPATANADSVSVQ